MLVNDDETWYSSYLCYPILQSRRGWENVFPKEKPVNFAWLLKHPNHSKPTSLYFGYLCFGMLDLTVRVASEGLLNIVIPYQKKQASWWSLLLGEHLYAYGCHSSFHCSFLCPSSIVTFFPISCETKAKRKNNNIFTLPCFKLKFRFRKRDFLQHFCHLCPMIWGYVFLHIYLNVTSFVTTPECKHNTS